MIRTASRLGALATLLLVAASGLTGCDAVEGVFGGENEVTGIVESVDAASLTVDATRYTVDANTTFEAPYTALADVEVGDEVEVEYEDRAGERAALAIGDNTAPDNDTTGGN